MFDRTNPLVYSFLQKVFKLSLTIFFQKIDTRHAENIPTERPVIFVANHPSSTMDALIMSTAIKRRVHFIAHSGLFANRFKAWILRSCGVIPVYRRTSKGFRAEGNIEAFQECYKVLEEGETIGIFPEGISDMQLQVKKLKTGAARILLEAEKKNNYRLGVRIIPVGLHFFSRSHFRSRVLLNIGRPIELTHFFMLNEQDNVKAVTSLTEKIQEELEHLTIHIQNTELEELVRDIERIYMDDLLASTPASKKSSSKSTEEFVTAQRIAECVDYYYQHAPLRVRRMKENIEHYKRKLKRLHLKDKMIRDRPAFHHILRPNIKKIIKAIAGFPAAFYGAVNNYLPYRITERIAKKYMHDRTKILTALFFGGGSAFIVFYCIQVFFIWYFFGHLWGILYLISLPVTGFFTLAYLKMTRDLREQMSFSFFIFTNRNLVGKMRRTRNMLISEMNAVKDEYLSLIGKKAKASKP